MLVSMYAVPHVFDQLQADYSPPVGLMCTYPNQVKQTHHVWRGGKSRHKCQATWRPANLADLHQEAAA